MACARIVLAGLVGAALALTGSPVVQATARHPSAEETLAEFRAYCERVRGSHDPYFGTAAVGEQRSRIDELAGDPAGEIRERLRLSYELIRLGQHAEAIAQAETALQSYQKLGLGPSGVLVGIWKLLGVAHYQLGEDANCVSLHNEGSCILPIRPDAVHRSPEHARQAGDAFLEVLRLQPGDVNARWLLNLSRMVAGDYPHGVPEPLRFPADAFTTRSATAFPLWIDVAQRLGVATFDLAGGAVIDDFDGDGLLDLVSSTWDPCGPLAAHRNLGERGFEDMTKAWGLDSQLGGLNLVHADYDGDGDLDLLVTRGAWQGPAGRIRRSLLRNDLRGDERRFVDVTAAARLDYPAYPSQAAVWADYDADGDLDLFVGTEGDAIVVDPALAKNAGARAHPSQLFRNDGDGTFTDVAAAVGIDDHSFTKGAAWGDYDDDGDEDLFLSNFGPDRMFRNRGDGTFEDATAATGVAGDDTRRNFASWFFDYDNDGDLDLYVSSFHVRAETVAASYLGLPNATANAAASDDDLSGSPYLYRNDGGRFTEVSHQLGLDAPLLVMGANFGDLDADGWLDLYLGTGQPDFAALHPNVHYRNVGGERFEDLTFRSGLGHLQKGHGVAFGDLDRDGDEDLFEQIGGAYPYDQYFNALYLNPSQPGGDHHFVVLKLRGVQANRFGVGARVRLDLVDSANRPRQIHRRVDSGGSFGGSSFQLEVGLGDAVRLERIEIRWPGSRKVDVFQKPAFDRVYEAVEGATELREVDEPPFRFRLTPATHEHPGPGSG